jgi:glutamate formiminotransferase/glutamate formiminotransferase/formiminotetrahydrofolate cyclodeaminase
LIDLARHKGAHPRVGATDVVPFVPIRGATMEDCIILARSLGKRIGGELDIPVFLYERAAARPERAGLEAIRRGGPEGLSARMADPAWAPDYGPSGLHPTAGATVVGARPPLIAYNVNLGTENLSIAKEIAKTVRFSSGGLPAVKAMGVHLASRRLVQVSMNLTNFEETPVHVAFEAVRREAERRSVEVVESEVVGLIPQQAMIQASEYFLKLRQFDRTQVLETRIDLVVGRSARPQDRPTSGSSGVTEAVTLTGFLSAVSAGAPTPGGGSVAALAGALAASLGLKACRIKTQSAQAELAAAERRLGETLARFQSLVTLDAEAYEGVVKAARLPKSDPAGSEAMARALLAATHAPLETAILACEVGSILHSLIPAVKPSVHSDLYVGFQMAVASAEGGIANAVENVKCMTNQQVKDDMENKIEAIRRHLVELRGLC